jgi:hypothetical protein
VLRNSHSFTRPVGPGVVFTLGNEYFASAVDLHPQGKNLGPKDSEDPFSPRQPNEDLDDFEQRQKNRYLTSALTRDGVEVVPNISVFFKLLSEPGEGNTAFGYNPYSVWDAVGREGINPDAAKDTSRHHVSWDWLPIYLAVDLWREYLRKFTLDQLFTFLPGGKGGGDQPARSTAFNTITRMMRARLTEPEVENLDDNGLPAEGKIQSIEYCLLQERGIQLMGVGVRNLRFPDEVEEQLLAQWQATWMQRAQADGQDIGRLHARIKNEGQDLAYKAFASAVSRALIKRLEQADDTPLSQVEVLTQLVQGTLTLCNRETELQTRLTRQKAGLVEMLDWIKKT